MFILSKSIVMLEGKIIFSNLQFPLHIFLIYFQVHLLLIYLWCINILVFDGFGVKKNKIIERKLNSFN